MNNYYKRGVGVKRGVMQAGVEVVAICRKFNIDTMCFLATLKGVVQSIGIDAP